MTQHAAAFGGLDTESDAPYDTVSLRKTSGKSMWFYTTAGPVKIYIVSSLCLRLTQPLTQQMSQQIVRSIRLALGFNVRQIFMLSYGSSVPLFLIPSSI